MTRRIQENILRLEVPEKKNAYALADRSIARKDGLNVPIHDVIFMKVF